MNKGFNSLMHFASGCFFMIFFFSAAHNSEVRWGGDGVENKMDGFGDGGGIRGQPAYGAAA